MDIYAGITGSSGNVNGQRLLSKFQNLIGLTLDVTGNLYIADSDNFVVKKIELAIGIVSTIVGDRNFNPNIIYRNQTSSTSIRTPVDLGFNGITGDLMILDSSNFTLIRITSSTGNVEFSISYNRPFSIAVH